jgi:hypothetical protein
MQTKSRARLTIKIEPTSNSKSHLHFTEHLVCETGNPSQEYKKNLKTQAFKPTAQKQYQHLITIFAHKQRPATESAAANQSKTSTGGGDRLKRKQLPGSYRTPKLRDREQVLDTRSRKCWPGTDLHEQTREKTNLLEKRIARANPWTQQEPKSTQRQNQNTRAGENTSNTQNKSKRPQIHGASRTYHGTRSQQQNVNWDGLNSPAEQNQAPDSAGKTGARKLETGSQHTDRKTESWAREQVRSVTRTEIGSRVHCS